MNEEEHTHKVKEVAYNAMLELRDTLDKKFNAVSLGYNDADHARLTIVKVATKQIDKLCAEHLKRCGK